VVSLTLDFELLRDLLFDLLFFLDMITALLNISNYHDRLYIHLPVLSTLQNFVIRDILCVLPSSWLRKA